MMSLEIPLNKRSAAYRFFEILPAALSYGSVILLVVLSLFKPFVAAMYLLLIIITMFIKSLAVAIRTIQGYDLLQRAQKVNWQARVQDIEEVQTTGVLPHRVDRQWQSNKHLIQLEKIQQLPLDYPKISKIYNAVIIATYNESIETLRPTIQAVADTDFSNEHIAVIIAYEERGGDATQQVVQQLREE